MDSMDGFRGSLQQNIDPNWRGGPNPPTIVVITNVVVTTNIIILTNPVPPAVSH